MSLFKFNSIADTSITNAFKNNSLKRAELSNTGGADSLQLFSVYKADATPEKSRILINFSIEDIINKRNSGKIPYSGSVKFIFKLFNVQHAESLPKNYYISLFPISGSWEEGSGLDIEYHTDQGVSASYDVLTNSTSSNGFGASWLMKSSTTAAPTSWTTPGGDYFSNYEKSFFLETGLEDVEIDVTDIVEQQISNILPRDGFLLALSSSYEDGTRKNTYYTKRFSARSSQYFYSTPSLEARWDALITDDRNNFLYESPNLSPDENNQNIYFLNKVNGNLKNIYGNPTLKVDIYSENNTILTSSIPVTNVSAGIYKAMFKLTGSIDSELKDVWYSGSNEYYTGTIFATKREFNNTLYSNEYVVSLKNLKNIYSSQETANIKIFAREKNWSPNVYKVQTDEINNLTFNNLYYKIYRIIDNKTIIDYGTVPTAYTKCGYDKDGNYFEINMNLLEPGFIYAVKFMLLEQDEINELPYYFKFKVE